MPVLMMLAAALAAAGAGELRGPVKVFVLAGQSRRGSERWQIGRS